MEREPFVEVDEVFKRAALSTFYDHFYASITDDLIRWRAVGAVQKCETIVSLARDLGPQTVLEIGAGTCSITDRLAKMAFAPKFFVLEVSPSAVEFIRSRVRIPELEGIYLADSSRTGLKDDSFDLGILSHVLEHVTDPLGVLREALRICRHVVLEVPLEDCLLTRLDWGLRERVLRQRRIDNPSGHIHFFGDSSIRSLIASAGGVVLRERLYFPSLETTLYGKNGFEKLRLTAKHKVFELAFRASGPRLVIGYYGALTRRRGVDEEQRLNPSRRFLEGTLRTYS